MWGIVDLPDGPGPHPGVLLLHGLSGWRPGYQDLARGLSEAGFATLTLDYYAQTGGASIGSDEKLQKWEEWRRTVRNAVRHLRSLPSVDGGGIALVGISRGAFLAVSSGASTPGVSAVVNFYGGGGGGTLSLEEEVVGLPPLLILHGEEDGVVPVSFAHRLRAAALEAGVEVEIHLYPGEEHAFNLPWVATYSPSAARDAFDRTVAFLRTRLGG